MSLQGVYSSFLVLGFLAEIALLAVLIVRRHYRTFPIFCLYILVNTASDVGVGLLMSHSPAHTVRAVAVAILPLVHVLELGVLLEITWHVLQPVQVSLPSGVLQAFLGVVVLAVIGGAVLAWHVDSSNAHVNDLKDPIDLTVGVLRILIFVLTASFAQMLGIGWKNKVLQLATALSFYSAVDLIVSLTERTSGRYASLEPIHGMAYALELGFLVYTFTTKDVKRREFSPQMEEFLVTIAGKVKHARVNLVRMQVKSR